METAIFGNVKHWIYHQEIPKCNINGAVDAAKTWVMGAKFQISELQNAVMDTMYQWFVLRAEPEEELKQIILLAYQKDDRAKLRDMVVRQAARNPTKFAVWLSDAPAGFALDFVERLHKAYENPLKHDIKILPAVTEFYVDVLAKN